MSYKSDNIIPVSIDPLGDKVSSVELIDWLGSDLTVVNAARVSMAKESELGPDNEILEKDEKLIKYLATHGHWTPFSQPQLSFRIKMPIAVARQWFKHQIGVTRNETSRRYVSDQPEYYFPDQWREKAENVKQGSKDGVHPMNAEIMERYANAIQASNDFYNWAIENGVAAEQARFASPQSMYTEFIETGSLAYYARVAHLRLDPHAQLEVRNYAKATSFYSNWQFPVSWKYLAPKLNDQ